MTVLARTLSRHGRDWARQLLFALACLQVFAPAAAAVADAWRADQRTPYAHVEAQGATGCAMVHGDDCLLCAIATNVQARPASVMPLPSALAAQSAPVAATCAPAAAPRLPHASSRAPPSRLG
ncbi:MAG: hypothetical protein K2R93_12010 [Gemmatimonadaceae bacterium]|nr:hypothetical protein [Gemmatimonadaceae bacterium]